MLRYSDDDDAVRIANNSQYGLSGAVWGTDVDRAVARCAPGAYRADRGQRFWSRRCAVRRLQPERVRPGKRRDHGNSSVHGAEGHGIAGVGRSSTPLAGLRWSRSPTRSRVPTAANCSSTSALTSPKLKDRNGIRCVSGARFPAANPIPIAAGCSSTSTPASASPTSSICEPGAVRARAHRATPTS